MKNKLLLSILSIYILVPILILFNNYLYGIKFYLLTIIGLIIFLLMKLFKVPNKDLGITKENLFKSIKRNLPLIVLCVIIILLKPPRRTVTKASKPKRSTIMAGLRKKLIPNSMSYSVGHRTKRTIPVSPLAMKSLTKNQR